MVPTNAQNDNEKIKNEIQFCNCNPNCKCRKKHNVNLKKIQLNYYQFLFYSLIVQISLK